MKLKKDSASLGALKALLAGILCVMTILSAVSCGKDLSAFPEENSRTEDAGPEPSDGAGKEEKWAFYVYMVGSDLESAHLDQLSKFTKTLVEEEAKKQEQEYNDTVAERLRTFTEEVYAEGLELPGALFNKTEYQAKNDEEPDPDATGYATYSLDLMLSEEIPEGVEFVIQTGGTRRWQSPLVNPNRSQRFVIDCDGIGEVSNEPIVNMADPETLEDFIVFCKEYYPAQHEVLLFWDHGGGYSGFGMDEIFGEDMLTVREIAGAIGNAGELFSQDRSMFDIIAFDACLMCNLETARIFSDYADYYLASAEEMSGLGWGYDRIISALRENPDLSVEELGAVVADANVANVQSEEGDDFYPATFSFVDLKKVGALYDEWAALVRKTLIGSLADVRVLNRFSADAASVLAYACGNCGGFNVIDLRLFAQQIADDYPEESARLIELVDECVLYLCTTSYYDHSGGISVFFPARITGMKSMRKFLSYLYDVSDNPDLDALYYYKVAGCLNEKLSDYVTSQGYGTVRNIDYSVLDGLPYLDVELGDGNIAAELTEEQLSLIQSMSMGLIFCDEEYGGLVHFCEMPYVRTEEGGTAVSTDFDLRWPSIDGNELPAEVLSDDGKTVLYRALIDYYGTECYLIFYYDRDTEKYTIGGISLDMDNGTALAPRSVISLDEGDEFSFVYKYSGLFTSVSDKAYVDCVYTADTEIVDKTLADGLYYSYIRFDDLRSDIHYSPITAIVVEDGTVTDQYADYSLVAFDYGGND